MKTNLSILVVVMTCLLLTLPFSCKKEAPKVIPSLTTTAISSITSTTATGGGSITSDGGSTVTSRGVCWNTTQNPTTSDSKTTDGSGSGSFTSSISGLTPGSTYYVKAYAINSVGTAYGSQVTFSATAILPIITTTAASAITSTTATSGGNITGDGGSAVTARGVCWATTTSPTTSNSKTTDGMGTGTFTSAITGLSPGTTYYARAYVTNIIGTAYGNEISITTLAIVPTLTTTEATAITKTTATSGGNITNDGGSAVTARGVCWSTVTAPTISNSKTTNGTGTGTFVSSITGLAPGTTYYARAYATNNAGTSYGNEITIVALANLPTLTTKTLTSVTSTSFTSGGNITNDGGGAITARGVCWSTTTGPTISNSKTTNGTGAGTFVSSVSGLTAGLTYYVRAYATNSAGTAYGNELRANGLTDDINNLVPQSIIDELRRLGMPINSGYTPPTINGIFSFSPNIMVNTNIVDDFEIGSIFGSMRVQFSSQNNTAFTVNIEYVEVNSSGTILSTSVGNGSLIVGSGQAFTAFGKVTSAHPTGEVADVVIIFSGNLGTNNILNFYHSLFMLDNHGYSTLISNGSGRVFYDSDGVSEKITSLTVSDQPTKSISTGTGNTQEIFSSKAK